MSSDEASCDTKPEESLADKESKKSECGANNDLEVLIYLI